MKKNKLTKIDMDRYDITFNRTYSKRIYHVHNVSESSKQRFMRVISQSESVTVKPQYSSYWEEYCYGAFTAFVN